MILSTRWFSLALRDVSLRERMERMAADNEQLPIFCSSPNVKKMITTRKKGEV
jgi:hypothetical protein